MSEMDDQDQMSSLLQLGNPYTRDSALRALTTMRGQQQPSIMAALNAGTIGSGPAVRPASLQTAGNEAGNPAPAHPLETGSKAANRAIATSGRKVEASPAEMPGAGARGPSGQWSPVLTELTRHFMKADEAGSSSDSGDTKEDRGLALAAGGFGAAASGSPYALQAIGQGGVAGIQALMEQRQQRALMNMRRDQIAQAGALQAERLEQAQQAELDKKAAAEAAHLDRQDAIDQRRDAAKDASDAKRAAIEAGKDAARDRATALEESRYATQDKNRLDLFYRTGKWQALAGDEDRGVTGPPAPVEATDLPVVDDPRISEKIKQPLLAAKPKAKAQAGSVLQSFDMMAKQAQELYDNKHLEGALGATGWMAEHSPFANRWKDVRAKIDSLQSKTALNAQTNLRQQSPTGGALGNTSDKDMALLKDSLTSLRNAQTYEQFREALVGVRDFAKEAGGRQRQAYIQTYGDKDAPQLPWENVVKKDEAPVAGSAAGNAPPQGKIHVRKGSEAYYIDPAQAEEALKDGFEVVK